MHRSSTGCRVAQNRAQRSSGGCSVAQKVQCSSVGCSLAQWKDIRPWRPEFGPEGKHFVSGNRLSLFLKNKKQRSCDGRGGRAAPLFGELMSPKRRVRAAAHAWPKHTSTVYLSR